MVAINSHCTDEDRPYSIIRSSANGTPDVHACGRLATSTYDNMDQVVAQALAPSFTLMGLRRPVEIGA